MSASQKSIFWFALLWVLPNGLALIAAPEILLRLLGLEVAGSMWLRIMGMLVVIFSYYYVNLARQGNREFFRWTVHTRALVPLVFAAFYLTGMPPIVMAFAIGDFAGAVWTALALRSEGVSVF